MIVDIIIENPKGCRYKYKYENGKFVKKYKLKLTGGICPYNYGFVENTIAPDKSQLDIIVVGNKPLKQGHTKAKVIGAITRYDKDDKIVAVNYRSKINSIKQMSKKKLNLIISTWTGNWHDMKPLKKVIDKKDAVKLIKKCTVKR